jgi:hypothetical protein
MGLATSPTWAHAVGAQVYQLAAADMDSDGDQDLVQTTSKCHLVGQ